MMYGEPISVERKMDESQLEKKRLEIENIIKELDTKAENYFSESYNLSGNN